MADNVVSRIYGNFRGADFRGEEIHLSRSPDCMNIWKDYRQTESIRTRPGMESKHATDGTVYGIFFFKDLMIVHCGQILQTVKDGATNTIYSGLLPAQSNGFVYKDPITGKDTFYFMDGKHYLQYDGVQLQPVDGYIPTTSIGRDPAGGGKLYEDINMLQPKRINSFLADGNAKEYYLDARDIDNDFVPQVTFTDQQAVNYTVDYAAGKIIFENSPSAPIGTDGQDNIQITFKKSIDRYRESILNCTLLQVFDNRVFVSGNKDYPNVVWHCSLNDPTYFSDTDYYQEGLDTSAVRGMVAGNNALWVFREPSDASTNVFYHTPTLDEEYGKIYPAVHSSVTTGCIGKAINFNDDIVFFSDRGMEGISGDVSTEQALAHRSSMVDRKLIAEKDYRNMILAEWEGYLLCFIGNKAYVADSRAMLSNENHMEYEWFYWEMEAAVTCATVKDGILYLGTEKGVYTLTGNGSLQSWWVTPKDKFNHPNRMKTSNKRGCVAEATGDVSVFAKVEDSGFEHIGTYMDVIDCFISRIKRKKFKDIQLKFYSYTRFSLETVTLECFIGGYIKRSETAVLPDDPNTGIIPEGTLLIQENGTYDVTIYAQAAVNVPEPQYEIWAGGSY